MKKNINILLFIIISSFLAFSFEYEFSPIELSNDNYTAYRFQNAWQGTTETEIATVVTTVDIPPDSAWHYIPLNTELNDSDYEEYVDIVHNTVSGQTEIRNRVDPHDGTPEPIEVWYYTTAPANIQVYGDPLFKEIMAPALQYSNPWWYIVKRETLEVSGNGEMATFKQIIEQTSRVFSRSAVSYCVLESKLGMAHWKKLSIDTDLFYAVDPVPLNPSMTSPNIYSDAQYTKISDPPGGPIWWQVITDQQAGVSTNENLYPPFNIPKYTGICAGDNPSKKSGYNIRVWVHATNREGLASFPGLMEKFTEVYYINRYTGEIGSASSDPYYFQECVRVIPKAEININDHMETHEIKLYPNNYKGMYLPDVDYDNSDYYTLEFDLDKQLNPTSATPRDLLFGKYLIIFFQIYPYDRFKNTASTYMNYYMPTEIDVDYTDIKYDIPLQYDHIADTPKGSEITQNFGLIGINKEIPPLTVSPTLDKINIEYNVMNIDIILDSEDAGLNMSNDGVSKYYEWRAVQDFQSGTFENGSIIRIKP